MGVPFLLNLLSEYGTPLVRYGGMGTLASLNLSATTEWAAAQYDDGLVLCACQSDESGFGVMLQGPRSLSGTVVDGPTITCTKFTGEKPLLSHLPSTETGAWAVYRVAGLDVDYRTSGRATLLRYLLTNLEFGGRETAVTLTLPGIQGHPVLTPIPDDHFAPLRLRALRIARPTAWLELQAQASTEEADDSLASSICNILSVGRGTRVVWIQKEVLDTDGNRLRVVHSNRITKPFSPFAPIDPHSIGDTRAFIESTYTHYIANRDRYRLERGTIDTVLDAKVEVDFLETRGAKLALALEVLKQNVLIHADPNLEFIIPQDQFTKAVPALSDCIRETLLASGATAVSARAISAHPRLYGLNRRGFGRLIRRMAKDLGFLVSQRDLDLFVQCRNSLVHRGDYYCMTATAEERVSLPPLTTRFAEYTFMMSIVDAFLLRLIGYTGPYVTRDADGQHVMKQL